MKREMRTAGPGNRIAGIAHVAIKLVDNNDTLQISIPAT